MNNKKLRRCLRYLIYTAVTVGYIFLAGFLTSNVFIQYAFSSQHNNVMLYATIGISFIFGLLLGFERLFREIKKKKTKWKFNVPRFLLCGIPAFILALIVPIYYFFENLLPVNFIDAFTLFSEFGNILFGYILISNFTREKLVVNFDI